VAGETRKLIGSNRKVGSKKNPKIIGKNKAKSGRTRNKILFWASKKGKQATGALRGRGVEVLTSKKT